VLAELRERLRAAAREAVAQESDGRPRLAPILSRTGFERRSHRTYFYEDDF